jgi:hypothetical protein
MKRTNGRPWASTWFLICASAWCASFGSAQVDSYNLRSKFGEPIANGPGYEVFRSKEGVQLRVRYSPSRRTACSIEIGSGVADAAIVERVLAIAVPIHDRGKIWNRLDEFDGLSGDRRTYYENVVITEDIFTPRALDKRPGATVIFKKNECGRKDANDPFDRELRSPSTRSN